jgi:hypothetical protein
MTTTGSPAVHISAAIQAQGKAIVGGVVAAVVAAEAPLVQGGHWSLNTLYAAAVSAVVGYLLVWVKANGPSEVTALLGLLVGHTHATTAPTVAVSTPVAPVAAPEPAPAVPSVVDAVPVVAAPPAPLGDLTASIEAALAAGKAAATPAPPVAVTTPAPAA